MRSPVAIQATSFLVPCSSRSKLGDSYDLSCLDHQFSSAYSYPKFILYFKSDYTSPSDIDALMGNLKASLVLTLNEYPVAAGRVRITEGGRLKIERVPGDGAEFIEATAEAQLDDWPDLRLCPIAMHLIPQDNIAGDIQEVPLMRIQVTVLKRGGIVLGFSSAHLLTDGTGASQFLLAWGEIYQQKDMSIIPVLSRSNIIKSSDNSQVHIRTMPERISYLEARPRNNLTLPPESCMLYEPHLLMMRLSDKKVDECVKEVEKGPFNYGRATAHEAICALLWSSLLRARELSSEEEVSTFYFPLNIRNRCDPPIPEAYFGNAALHCRVRGKAVTVSSSHISYAAKLIHEAIKRFDAQFCQGLIDEEEARLQEQDFRSPRPQFGDPNDIGGTTLAGFPMHHVDFGWGKPLRVTFVQIRPQNDPGPRCGMLIMSTPEGGRSREVIIGCPQREMDALLCDPVFSAYRDEQNDIIIRQYV